MQHSRTTCQEGGSNNDAGTVNRAGQLTLTIKGLSGVPLVGGLCHVQGTLTTKGLNELPLIGGLCLVQRTLTAMAN